MAEIGDGADAGTRQPLADIARQVEMGSPETSSVMKKAELAGSSARKRSTKSAPTS